MAKLRFNPSKSWNDAREMPAYSIPLASHYLRLPEATLRAWVLGRSYPTEGGTKRFRPVIELPDKGTPLLSFFNLAEAHILRSLRQVHGVQLNQIRQAIHYVSQRFRSRHPLVEQRFQTDGARLFVSHLGRLLDAASGQQVMKEVMNHLERLEFENELVARIYPFTRAANMLSPKSIFIDPKFCFGRPTLSVARVPTAVIAERYKAGESTVELAHDYACEATDIEEAIRCELVGQAA
ncbi:MAG: DUF433 domain-containing protein [Pirellulales bacterium]